MGGRSSDHRKLKREGITTAKDMLYAGLTQQEQIDLSRNTGIPLKIVPEQIKHSNQARTGGLKKVRARMYHDTGFDTLDKMAACDPAKLHKSLAEFTGQPARTGGSSGDGHHGPIPERLVEYYQAVEKRLRLTMRC